MNDGQKNLEVGSEPPAPDFSAAAQPSYAHTVFLGPGRLRAGWGLAAYVVMFYLLQRIAAQWAWSRDFGSSGLWSMMMEELGTLVAAVIPAIVLARIERRPWGSYGLPGQHAFGKLFWVGAAWGFAAITLLVAAMRGLHVFYFGRLALHGGRIVKFGLFWAVLFLLVGLSEEFRFRGYPQFTLSRAVGFWPSAVFVSAAFGLVHLGNEGENWRGLLAASAIGFFFCLTLRRTGNLWFAVGFHTAWDWGETYFYSVPDSGLVAPGHLLKSTLRGPSWLSGGAAGPEGSVLCFIVIAAVWVVFERAYRAAGARPNRGTDG